MIRDINTYKNRFIAFLGLALIISFVQATSVYAATSPTLGASGSYSVLGHTTVTNTGATTMPGDLGISIGGAPTGFPPGTVGPPGSIRNAADSLAAQTDNTAAFGYIDQGCDTTYPPGVMDLVGENLVAGVYCADAFELSGTLTLSGTGVWIFKSASTLITSGAAEIDGGDACNIWWRVVSSATLGSNTSFKGNILASTSTTLETGAAIEGRLMEQTGAVTLDNNTITGSQCLTSLDEDTEEVPGLPNAGLTPEDTATDLWKILIPTVALGLLLAAYFVRRSDLPKSNSTNN